MNLSSRLNLVAVIFFAIILFGVFYKTSLRTAQLIQQEEISSTELAVEMVDAQLKLLATYPSIEVRPEKLSVLFHLEQFSDSRYLNIELFDSQGELLATNHPSTEDVKKILSPLKHVFLRMLGEEKVIEREILLSRMLLGRIVISPNREAELFDIWSAVLAVMTPFLLMFLVVSLAAITVVTYIIKPVSEFIRSVNKHQSSHSAGSTVLSRLNHFLGLSQHLKGISHELENSSQKVQHLNEKILHLQEEERRRLSAELHDELGQHLTAIRFESAAIQTARTLDEAQQSASAIEHVGREMRDIVRSMLARLRPPSIEAMGLTGAITEMVGEWQLRHPQNSIQLDIESVCTHLSQEQQLSVYRIIQEAFTNISRHAGTDRLNVQLSIKQGDDFLRLHISDDGAGCDLNKQIKGHGLKGMAERVEALAGDIEIHSALGKGMQVKVQVPIVVENQA